MRNDPFVHDFRESIVDFQRAGNVRGFPSWITGFFASFVRDYDELIFDTTNEKDRRPFEQQKKSFDLAFEAGLKLREAVEEYQKDYPKEDKFSDWCK